MRIALSGAETFLGTAVAACLEKERGYTAIPVAAPPSDARSFDGLIHCGEPSGDRDPAMIAATIDALEGSGRPFVYTSSAWVMGNTRGRLAGEAFPLNPPPGLEWLPAAERQLFDTTVRGVRGVVIRPAIIYGYSGGLLEQLASGALPLIEPGENHWSFIHVDDLAELYVLAMENAPAGSLYVAADGPPATFRQVAAACAAVPRRVTAEQARAELGAPLAAALMLDQRAGSTRAGRELGWKPSRPPALAYLSQGARA